jgi:hypothetical protein
MWVGWAVVVLEHVFMKNCLSKEYYLESRSRGISYMKYVNGSLTGLVIFCVETAVKDRLLKAR